jgi:hypothetical protein
MGPASAAIGPCARRGSPGHGGQASESHVASYARHDGIHLDTVLFPTVSACDRILMSL